MQAQKNKKINKKTGKSQVRPSQSRNLRSRERDLDLTLVKTYPRQIVWETWLPALPSIQSTTVTTGLIAQAYSVGSANVQAFATRFGSTFVEYRIIRAQFRLKMFSSTNSGCIQLWLDEQVTSAPTLAEAQERYIRSVSAAAVDEEILIKWVCSDTLDLQYLPIGTASTPVTFKAFTNNANFGAGIGSTSWYELVPEFQFQFRGLRGV